MVEIVNLRHARKAKARADAAAQADGNRIAHGVSKGERKLTKMQANKAERALASRKLEEKT
jgi:hypothetical protein